MKRGSKIALGVGGGVLAVAVVAIPAVAAAEYMGSGQGSGNGQGQGQGRGAKNTQHGQGMGNGQGMGSQHGKSQGKSQGSQRGQGKSQGQGQGQGMSGDGVNISNLASGTLTSAQRTALANMAEEEKMAHDLYVALGDKYPNVKQFQMIPNSESRHLQAIQSLLVRYSIADPTVSRQAGEFTNPQFQQLYDTLLAQGLKSQAAAMQVGVTVEKTDIADLTAAGKSVTAPDVKAVYANLTTGSEHHLAAFSR